VPIIFVYIAILRQDDPDPKEAKYVPESKTDP